MMSGQHRPRRYRFCGACGVHLQRLDPSTGWYVQAQALAKSFGMDRLSDMLAARIIHTHVCHPELTALPELVDDAAAKGVKA